MRALIERCLVERRAEAHPAATLLAQVEGEPSRALLDALARQDNRAAVLLGLVERPEGLTVLFTERAAHLTHHAGQVSFPGGRLEPGEAPVAGALREAWEEVRLGASDFSLAGCLDLHVTVTGFTVTPVVGFVRGTWQPEPDPAEVSGVFEVPFAFLADARNRRVVYRERLDTRFRVYEYRYAGHTIWGATAAMLVSFIEEINSATGR